MKKAARKPTDWYNVISSYLAPGVAAVWVFHSASPNMTLGNFLLKLLAMTGANVLLRFVFAMLKPAVLYWLTKRLWLELLYVNIRSV